MQTKNADDVNLTAKLYKYIYTKDLYNIYKCNINM